MRKPRKCYKLSKKAVNRRKGCTLPLLLMMRRPRTCWNPWTKAAGGWLRVGGNTQMIELPSYFGRRPAADWSPATVAGFERLYAEAVAPGSGVALDYTLAAPKWQFLCWLCDTQDVLVHGSGNADIAEFEPRQSNDIEEFGNRQAVYAASDGIWAMYF